MERDPAHGASGDPKEADTLSDISNAVHAIQRRLEQYSQGAGLPAPPTIYEAKGGSAQDLASKAGKLYRTRRRRDELFGADRDMFGEAAWDILLDLFVAHHAKQRVSISSACIAASVPTTTGLRYVAHLEERGFVERARDNFDGRRTWLVLTDYAAGLMAQCLQDFD